MKNKCQWREISTGFLLFDATVPSGAILIWSGAVDAIPSGYVLCDGQNNTPDLRNRFIIGAGSSYNVGSTGGSTSHNHSLGIYGYPSSHTGWDSGAYDLNQRSTNSTTTLPPYYALCYIMKTYPVEE